jgi:hypothetical protein
MKAKKNLVIKRKKKHDNVDWSKIVVSNNKPLNGEEISEEIYNQTGVRTTRQNVSNALKSGLKKFYLQIKNVNPKLTPFQRAALMVEMLYPNYTTGSNIFRGGINSFFNLLPPDIKKRVLEDAKAYYSGEKKSSIMGDLGHDMVSENEGTDLLQL